MFTYSPNIAINVRNPKKAVEFYRDILGFAIINTPQATDAASDDCGTEMRAGAITFWIDGAKPGKEAEFENRIGHVFFEFFVEDLPAAVAKLEEYGCRLGQKTGGEKFSGQMLEDPYGMRFHLYCKKY